MDDPARPGCRNTTWSCSATSPGRAPRPKAAWSSGATPRSTSFGVDTRCRSTGRGSISPSARPGFINTGSTTVSATYGATISGRATTRPYFTKAAPPFDVGALFDALNVRSSSWATEVPANGTRAAQRRLPRAATDRHGPGAQRVRPHRGDARPAQNSICIKVPVGVDDADQRHPAAASRTPRCTRSASGTELRPSSCSSTTPRRGPASRPAPRDAVELPRGATIDAPARTWPGRDRSWRRAPSSRSRGGTSTDRSPPRRCPATRARRTRTRRSCACRTRALPPGAAEPDADAHLDADRRAADADPDRRRRRRPRRRSHRVADGDADPIPPCLRRARRRRPERRRRPGRPHRFPRWSLRVRRRCRSSRHRHAGDPASRASRWTRRRHRAASTSGASRATCASARRS